MYKYLNIHFYLTFPTSHDKQVSDFAADFHYIFQFTAKTFFLYFQKKTLYVLPDSKIEAVPI